MPALNDENILRLLKQLNLVLEGTVNRIFSDSDLTAAQCDVLSYLIAHEGPDLSATMVHKNLHLSRAAVSTLLKRLKGKGYVSFRASLEDDRQKQILLTEKATHITQEMDSKAEKITTAFYKGFSLNEREELECMIRKIIFNLNQLQ